MTNNKEFDCVEMKHKAAEKIQKRLSGKTAKDRLIFWKIRHEEMLARQKAAQQKIKKAS